MVSFTQIANGLIESLGVWGIGVGAFFSGLGVPGLSEVLVPLGGVALRQGSIDLVLLLVVAMVTQMLGVVLAYLLARHGGLPFIERYGKYVFISRRELGVVEHAFERHGGWLVVVWACMPGIQGLIGYAAGVARMNFGRFIVSVFVGKLVWTLGLVYSGFVLGQNLESIDHSMDRVGIAVSVILVVVSLWYFWQHHKHGHHMAGVHKEN